MCRILPAVGGRCCCQIEGRDPVELGTGDVAYIPSEAKHWHGASPTEALAHEAIMPRRDGASNEWLEPVDEEAYRRLA